MKIDMTVIIIICRLVNAYNNILDTNPNVSDSSVNVFYNDCPSMLEPLKKISVTKILQASVSNPSLLQIIFFNDTKKLYFLIFLTYYTCII